MSGIIGSLSVARYVVHFCVGLQNKTLTKTDYCRLVTSTEHVKIIYA